MTIITKWLFNCYFFILGQKNVSNWRKFTCGNKIDIHYEILRIMVINDYLTCKKIKT